MEYEKKYERKFLAHYIDPNFNTAGTGPYTRLGKDLEEYAIELNPDVETKTNIIGENSVNVKGYKPQSSVDPYYAYEGDPLYETLQTIFNERSTGREIRTTVVDVLVNSEGTVEWAYREEVVVVPQKMGGSDGVQIPFEVYYAGNRVKGGFDVSAKTFTVESKSASTNAENS